MMESIWLVVLSDVLFFAALAILVWIFRRRITLFTQSWFSRDARADGEDVSELRLIGAVLGALVWAVSVIVGLSTPISLGFGVIVAGLTPTYLRRYRQQQIVKAFEASLIESLTTIASSLRAGLTLHASLKVAANNCPPAFAREVSIALKQYRLGVPIEEALDGIRQRIATANTNIAFGAMIIATQLGGNLPDILARIVHTIRERERVEGKLRSLTAQGRLQALVLCSAPVVIGVLMYLYDGAKMRMFTESFAGQFLLVLAIVLEVIGIFATRKVMRLEI